LHPPTLPKPSGNPSASEPSKEDLFAIIHESHLQLGREMSHRNYGLKLLSNVARSRNNTDPKPDVPWNVPWNVNAPEQNVYITYWRTNQIQLLNEASGDTPYSFTKVMNGDEVIEGIGLPKEIPQIAQLPQGWDQWHTATLRDVTMDITSRYDAIIKDIMDDRNEVERALRYVCGRTKRLGPQRQKSAINVVRPVPAQTSKHHDEDAIKMIQNARNQLQKKVVTRNHYLRVLSKIPLSRNIPDPDVPNVYVNYWRSGEIKLSPEAKSQGSKPDGDRASGSGGISNVLPSTNKRPWDAFDAQGTGASVCGSNQLMTPYYDITEEEALAEMLEETAAALQSHKDGGHSPEHSHWLTSGSVPWHFDGGLTPSTSFPAPNSPSDAATAPSDPRVGVCNPSSEVQKNEHPESYFDYNERERGRSHKKGKHER
ncbi:hypothetical protein H0H93_012317, partial [Arthromyces matolae]